MATPEDIIEARRVANVKKMAQTSATKSTTSATTKPKTDAQKDAELGVNGTDSTALAYEQAKIAAQRTAATATTTVAIDPYYVRDPKTGLSPAQVDAQKALQEAQAGREQLGLGGFISTTPGSAGKIETPPTEGLKQGYEWYKLSLPGGGFEWRQRPKAGAFSAGTDSTGITGVTGFTGGGNMGGGITNPVVTGTEKTVPTLAKDIFKQTLAMFFGQADASKPWMDELYNAVSKFYLNGADVSESLNMALLDSRNNPNLREFTDRFKGIYSLMDMKQAGKPVTIPTIAEYVSSQAKMADILTQANLTGLATTEYTGELIGKGNSVSTIADKIANVFNRIDLAPKDVKDTLSRYFPTADRLKLAGALLQGEKGVTQLADELAQYEVLAAAEAQGVGALGARGKAGGVTEERAQQYARAGGTYQSLLPKFGQVAAATPTVSKLAGISGTQDIGQVGVEKALILSGEAERAALEKLSAQEEARFAAKAGRMEQGLASQRRANRAF